MWLANVDLVDSAPHLRVFYPDRHWQRWKHRWRRVAEHNVEFRTSTHARTHIPGPSLALMHSAGMSVWRQALVCAPGMRNLTSRLEFEPLHSSSRFSEIRCSGCASCFPTECLNNYIKSSPTTFKWRPQSRDWTGASSSADFCKRHVKNCVSFREFSVHGLQKEIDSFL